MSVYNHYSTAKVKRPVGDCDRMPIKLEDGLPAMEILRKENIFVMGENRAVHQDIRPLKLAVLNIMPTKVETETQILRLLGNTPLQVEVTLIRPDSYTPKNTPIEYLERFYKTFSEIRNDKFDGLVITGAPVEHLPFEEVSYWKELTEIMDWSTMNVYSTLFICWAAQAGLYHFYGIGKHQRDDKMFGVFPHRVSKKHVNLLRGFDDIFWVPHSRNTFIRREDVEKVDSLEILAESDEAGVYILKSQKGRRVFVTGHSEYDPHTLKKEYERDIEKGIKIQMPANYFPDDNPENEPVVYWRSHANLLFSNWLNYYVYQETPYDIKKIK